MYLQYISDNTGQTTGVFIPIHDWNLLTEKYSELEKEINNLVPQWHKPLLDKRLEEYLTNPTEKVKDFETACNEIENELEL
jgi:hypothetical protein